MPENTTDTQQTDAQEAQDIAVDQNDTTEQQSEQPEEQESEREQERPEEDDAGEDEDTTDEDESQDRDTEKLVAKLRKKNSENQKLRARATEAETKLMRYRVASEIDFPMHLAERLQGNTPEELKKDAENLLQHLAPASVLGFVPDDGRRSGVEGEVKTPSLSEIGARMYER